VCEQTVNTLAQLVNILYDFLKAVRQIVLGVGVVGAETQDFFKSSLVESLTCGIALEMSFFGAHGTPLA